MKNSHKLIHLPELSLSYDSLQKYLKNLYNIDIKMENTTITDKKTAPSPRGYRKLGSGKLGSMLEQNLKKNKVNIITTPDPDIAGYVIIHVKETDIDKAKDVIAGRAIAANGKNLEQINVSYYHWGQYKRDEQIDLIDLPVIELTQDQLSGFDIRDEDQDKYFYASDIDIDEDEEGDEGTGVKHAYATVERHEPKAADGIRLHNDFIYQKGRSERFILINDMISAAEQYSHEEDVAELKADISDVNEDSSDDLVYWTINHLIDFNQANPRIDEFIKRAKDLGWADQYAKDGKTINKLLQRRIADDILRQLGGIGRIKMMTGAYNFIERPNGVSFRLKNPSANYVKITLTSKDLYDLEVGRIRGAKYTVVETKTGLYDNMLRPAIEKATGLYLSLGTMGKKAKHGAVLEVSDISKRYVDYYMEQDIAFIFDKLGMDMPTELEGDYYEEQMADARTFAEGYFTENPDEMTDKYGNPFAFKDGGFVSKGEMVWNKITSTKRAEFLYENFTPEITPRSQELLVGKTYNFLPKNVKIKIEAKYANVEEYNNGGGVGNENALMVMSDNKQIKHHTEELNKVIDANSKVPAWVVSKVNRSASDLSDATHYMDGVSSKFDNGGEIKFKKVNQFGSETLYQATDGETTIPYSITRIRDKKGTLLRMENSKTGLFETYSMDEVHGKIRGLFMESANENILSIKVGDINELNAYIKENSIQTVSEKGNDFVISDNGKFGSAEEFLDSVEFSVPSITSRRFISSRKPVAAANGKRVAADGKEIDEMVTDWKNVKKALGGNSGGGMFDPKALKAYSVDTQSIHNIIKIDYDDDLIVMTSDQHGRTKSTLNKVKLLFAEGSGEAFPKDVAVSATPIATVKTTTPVATVVAPVTTPVVETSDINPTTGKPFIKYTPVKKAQSQVIKVDPTKIRTNASKVLQEMWAEAKGQGLTLISSEYMQQVEDTLMSSEESTPLIYETMIQEILAWLDDSDIVLRSKPFMKKIRQSLES